MNLLPSLTIALQRTLRRMEFALRTGRLERAERLYTRACYLDRWIESARLKRDEDRAFLEALAVAMEEIHARGEECGSAECLRCY